MEYYRDHAAEVDVLADKKTLFLFTLIVELGSTSREALSSHLGWSREAIETLCRRLEGADLLREERALGQENPLRLSTQGVSMFAKLRFPGGSQSLLNRKGQTPMAAPNPPSGEHIDLEQLLLSWSRGDKKAFDELVPLIYRELLNLATAYIRREGPDQTLQPEDLVNEVYLRMANHLPLQIQDRRHFFAIAARLMRHILVDHARSHRAARRGGGKLELDAAAEMGRRGVDLIALDDVLKKLAELYPRQARIVELRFFSGMSEHEIAEVLGVSERTVKRDWRIASEVLKRKLIE